MSPFVESGPHNVLLIGGLIGCALFMYGAWQAFGSEFDGQVLSQATVCATPANNRCHYEYKVRLGNGELATFAPAGYVFKPQDFAVGNAIKKERFGFSYAVNDDPTLWPFAFHYAVLLLSSLGAIALSRSQGVRTEMRRHLG